VKYACIARHVLEFQVRLMCRVLAVSPSGFYAWRFRGPSKRSEANQRLKLHIRAVHRRAKKRYGAVKVHRELKAQRISCGKNRVARLMREDGLRSKRARHFRVTTQSGHAQPVAENHVARHFSLEENRERDRVWAADITYIPTREGWLYLAVILDLASRRVIGWSIDRLLDRTLVLNAMMLALTLRRPARGVLHHSDRGSQYASTEYQRLLIAHGMTLSMSRAGDCWDNAVAESFFATLKTELVVDANWQTRVEAKKALVDFIEVWYNRQRRHQTLGYLTPVQYELEMLERANAA
jgi:putative transposase